MLLSSNGALWKSCQLFIRRDQITGIANKPPARLETTPARAGGLVQMPGKITLPIFLQSYLLQLITALTRLQSGDRGGSHRPSQIYSGERESNEFVG